MASLETSLQVVEAHRDQKDNSSNPDCDLLSSGHDGGSMKIESSAMTLKNAAFLALIGTTLIAAHLLWTFVLTFINVLRDLVPAAALLSSLIYAFGSFTVAVFFYAFHRARSSTRMPISQPLK